MVPGLALVALDHLEVVGLSTEAIILEWIHHILLEFLHRFLRVGDETGLFGGVGLRLGVEGRILW